MKTCTQARVRGHADTGGERRAHLDEVARPTLAAELIPARFRRPCRVARTGLAFRLGRSRGAARKTAHERKPCQGLEQAPPTWSPPSTSARRHNLRLVVKGGGHAIKAHRTGRFHAGWTRAMKAVVVRTPSPAQAAITRSRAVSIEAGRIVGRRLQRGDNQGGRYVQGGGCTTAASPALFKVAASAPFSKQFGMSLDKQSARS